MELTVLAVTFILLLLIGVPVAFSIGLASVATSRRPARGRGVPENGRRNAGVLVPRDSLLRLCRRVDALRRHRAARCAFRQLAGGPCTRRPRNEQCARLHDFRRHCRFAPGRRQRDGLGNDSADEAGGLSRRLRRQRDDPRRTRGRAHADVAQPDHLHARHVGHRVGERVQPDPGRCDPVVDPHAVQPRRGVLRRSQARLSDARCVCGLARSDGVVGRVGSGLADRRHHSGGNPERRVHRHRIGGNRSVLGAPRHPG